MMYAPSRLLIPLIWTNSSHTALINFANRNTTSSYNDKDIYLGYFGAVGLTVPIVLVIRSLTAGHIDGIPFEMWRFLARNFTTWMAASFAGMTNLSIVRRKELKDGIAVFSPYSGHYLGRSRVAGSQAIFRTGFSRVMIGLSLMAYPFIWLALRQSEYLRATRFGLRGALLVAHGLSFWFWFIFSLSIFPRIGTIKATELESQFRHLKDPVTHQRLTHFLYNRGL